MNLKNKVWVRNLFIFLSIVGPGIITGSVDNDAGGITTYSVAGATYGYNLLWTLIPAFVVLLVVQEMNARMGVVTGKGLADLIRENFGVKVTFFIFLGLLTADIGNTATEFAGVAGSMQVLGVSKYIAVPLAAVAVWILVVKGTYRMAEKIFLIFSLFLLSYIISAVLAKPDWSQIGAAIVKPQVSMDEGYISTVLALIGTTIAPWMQFYMQSSVIEKGIKVDEYKYLVWDVILGCVATVVVAFFIVIACASTLKANNIQINEAKDAAMALGPLAGQFASIVFAFGLFIASVERSTPLQTAAKMMKDHNIGSVPVCEGDRVVGVITDRDIVLRGVAAGQELSGITCGQVMSSNPVVGSPDMDVHEAARLMSDNQIRRLPVVENGRLAGVVAIGDLAVEPKFVNEAGDALNDISKPSKSNDVM